VFYGVLSCGGFHHIHIFLDSIKAGINGRLDYNSQEISEAKWTGRIFTIELSKTKPLKTE
jgi:hypothetical protein